MNTNFGPGFTHPAIGGYGGPVLTVRDQIAIQAMVALLHNPNTAAMLSGESESFSISEQSYKMADAMLEARSK